MREASSARGVPFVVMGSTLYTLLPGLEFAPLAAAESVGDVTAAAETVVSWFVPIHVIGPLAFAAGILAFARAICDSAILTTTVERLVVVALVMTMLASSRVVAVPVLRAGSGKPRGVLVIGGGDVERSGERAHHRCESCPRDLIADQRRQRRARIKSAMRCSTAAGLVNRGIRTEDPRGAVT